MATKKQITDPLNLSKTQNGYVPLSDRFKSFPKDSEKAPITDQRVYFDNYANSTLEHADIGLLFPPPPWLRPKLNKQGLHGFYFNNDVNNVLLVVNNKYLVGVEDT